MYSSFVKYMFLLILVNSLPQQSVSQNTTDYEISFEVNRIHAPLSLTKEKIEKAKSISDLNPFFKTSWIEEYVSVELTTVHNQKSIKSVSKDQMLTDEQKKNLSGADIGSTIQVNMTYIPDNTLKHNDPKEFDFSFIVNPESEASFIGGQDKLMDYLESNALHKISDKHFNEYGIKAILFSINENGDVVDAHINDLSLFNANDGLETEEILLEAICKMPRWNPAKYSNGQAVKQDFVLTAGDHRSCVINMFNIDPEKYISEN